MAQEILTALQQRFPNDVLSTHSEHGDETAVIARERMLDIFAWLKTSAETDMIMLSDLTAVDYQGKKTPRFEVVYHLHSLSKGARLRIKVELEQNDARLDSISGLYESANWTEREVWDMYGIRFDGHPDLKRILLYEEFEGHPLRKDYPIRKRQPLIPMRKPDA